MATRRTNGLILAALVVPFVLNAAPKTGEDFTGASALAEKEKCPFVIYVHGSSWHPASRIFREKIWESAAFRESLPDEVILTEIHLGQQLSEEEAKAQVEKLKGWKRRTVRTFPAIQIFGNDGHLLKTIQGREMRELVSASLVTAEIREVLGHAALRRDFLAAIVKAREEKKREAELEALSRLIELPLDDEPKIMEQLKAVDPDDSTGWQARLGFGNWEFMRRVSGLIKEGKLVEAVTEADRLLSVSRHSPEQRALILGAKAHALVAQDQLSEAWILFQEARETDPDGPNGKAIWRYGLRVAGMPLREILPADSVLTGKEIGANISRDHARYSLSSEQHGNPENYPTLMKGRHAKGGFAFHTAAEKDANIVIDLQDACEVRALRITNRSSQVARAESLTLWTSSDGTTWEKGWASESAQPAWDVLLKSPVTARYLKLGLDRKTPEHLHLKAVDVYGKRPK